MKKSIIRKHELISYLRLNMMRQKVLWKFPSGQKFWLNPNSATQWSDRIFFKHKIQLSCMPNERLNRFFFSQIRLKRKLLFQRLYKIYKLNLKKIVKISSTQKTRQKLLSKMLLCDGLKLLTWKFCILLLKILVLNKNENSYINNK